jgi:UDP:flavonoid glycosyltransferase YjiC (YdhE family)
VRVVFSCRPAYGHLDPLLPLATASRDAGHDVTFGTGASALPRLRRLGFRAERVGLSIDAADAIRTLLDEPGYRLAAEGLAEEIAAMPSPADVVPALERLASIRP